MRTFPVYCAAVICLVFAHPAMSQTQTSEQTQTELDRLNKEKLRLQAEKEVVDAKRALAEAQKTLDSITKTPDPTAENLRKQKEIVDAQKALAESNRALQTANDAPDPSVSELKKEKELLEAKKALADAQKALEAAAKIPNAGVEAAKTQKELLEAQKAVADAQNALDAATAVPNELKAEKAVADARKDAANAEFDAWKAEKIGNVASASYSGAVELKEGAGKIEGALLAASAVKQAAQTVADNISGLDKINAFEVFAAKDFPRFQRLQAFRFQKEMVITAYQMAGINVPDGNAGATLEVAAPAAIGAGFEALSKILSWLKSDFTIGGVSVTVDESLLLYSVAGKLAEKGKIARLATVYEPGAMSVAVKTAANELAEVLRWRAAAVAQQSAFVDMIGEQDKKIAQEKDEGKKAELMKTVAALRPRVEKIKSAVTVSDRFVDALVTADPTTGTAPLTALVTELSIEQTLKNGAAVVLLKLESTGGGYFIKKNLLTGLGGMPLYHMGGATVTYVVMKGADGQVLKGDVVPIHGGFVKASDLKDVLKKNIIEASDLKKTRDKKDVGKTGDPKQTPDKKAK